VKVLALYLHASAAICGRTADVGTLAFETFVH
jgi:hypothetical protein